MTAMLMVMSGMGPRMISWNSGWVWFGWEFISIVVLVELTQWTLWYVQRRAFEEMRSKSES
jgi:hypothetical protein